MKASRESLLMGSVKLAEMILAEGIRDDKDAPGKAAAVMKAFQICVREGFDIPKPILEWVAKGFGAFLDEGASLDKAFSLKAPRTEAMKKEALFNYLVDLVWQESEAPNITTVCRYLSGVEPVPDNAKPWVNLFNKRFGVVEADTFYRHYERNKDNPPSELERAAMFIDFTK